MSRSPERPYDNCGARCLPTDARAKAGRGYEDDEARLLVDDLLFARYRSVANEAKKRRHHRSAT
jgi:hypothetical protein